MLNICRVTFFLMLLSSSGVQAASTSFTKISVVHPWPNGLHLTVASNENDPSQCGGGNGGFLLLPNSATNFQLISSVIISAWLAGKEIKLYTDCAGNNYSVIHGAMAK